jgi:hypothetical protein
MPEAKVYKIIDNHVHIAGPGDVYKKEKYVMVFKNHFQQLFRPIKFRFQSMYVS